MSAQPSSQHILGDFPTNHQTENHVDNDPSGITTPSQVNNYK